MEINWLFESNHLRILLFYWLDPCIHSLFQISQAHTHAGNSFRMTFVHPKHGSIYIDGLQVKRMHS